jgi:hypothetical protein
MIKFLAGSCLSELGIVMKEVYAILFMYETLVEAENFINSPGRFFHYEALFTSSFRQKFNYT